MSSYQSYDLNQPAFPMVLSSDEDFFGEYSIIQLEWLLLHGLLDFSEHIAKLGLPPQTLDDITAFSTLNDGSQDFPSDIAGQMDARTGQYEMALPSHSGPHIEEIGPRDTTEERKLDTTTTSSEHPFVELEHHHGRESAQSELADDPNDHPRGNDTPPQGAKTGRKQGTKTKKVPPSREKWRFRMYVPPTTFTSDDSRSPSLSPTTSTSSSSSASRRALEHEKDDLPNPLSSAPLKFQKTEGESLAMASLKKRRPRILYRHVPYNPRKHGVTQSKMEFIEWGGPTDESYWGERVLDGQNNGSMGMRADQVSDSGILTDGPSGMDGGSQVSYNYPGL